MLSKTPDETDRIGCPSWAVAGCGCVSVCRSQALGVAPTADEGTHKRAQADVREVGASVGRAQ
jgi:hypothetical protein